MRRERTKNSQKTPRAPILPTETLEVAARKEMLVDGVLGIAAYSSETVCIRTKCGFVEVMGKALVLCWSGEHRLLLRGHIENIGFSAPKRGEKRGR